MPEAISLTTADIVAMIVYMFAVIGIGLWFSRDEKTSEDYLLGGRKIPWYAVGISYMMSLFSTASLVSIPGEIFNHGLSLLVLGVLYPFFSVLSFYVFMGFYFKLKSFTPFEYLERRFDVSVRLLVSSIYLWTRLLYLAMVLFATSKVFEGSADWNPIMTIVIVGIIGIIYTVLGGMKAVVWTDVVQFVVLVGGIIVTIFICASDIEGGIGGIITYAFDHGHGVDLFTQKSFYSFDPYLRLCFWLLIIGKIMEPIFYNSGDQISIQRLLSTSSYHQAKKAIYTNAIIVLPFTFCLWFIGLAIYSYYSQNPDPRVTSGDAAFFVFISTKMPSPMPGIILSAMLAAAMSTLDSGMNSLSAVWVKEFHQKFINKNISEHDQVRLSRLTTLGVGLFAIAGAIAITISSSSLRESVMESMAIWGALGTILAPAFMVAVTSRRATPKLIWNISGFCFGINFGMVAWYLFSKNGLTGPLGTSWLIIPVVVTLCIYAAATMTRFKKLLCIVLRWIALLAAGYVGSILFWFIASRTLGGGELSFMWVGFPGTMAFLIAAYALAPFCKKIPNAKVQGLTLWTLNQNTEE